MSCGRLEPALPDVRRYDWRTTLLVAPKPKGTQESSLPTRLPPTSTAVRAVVRVGGHDSSLRLKKIENLLRACVQHETLAINATFSKIRQRTQPAFRAGREG